MIQKRNIIIVAVFLLMIGFGFAWADITVEDVLSFDLTQDDMIYFKPGTATKAYSLGINSAGDFIIQQDGLTKFRITPTGDVYMDGSLTAGTIPWANVDSITDCGAGLNVTGVDINGALICE